MNSKQEQCDELQPLLTALFDERMTAEEEMRLGAILRDNAEARQIYQDYCWTHALLRYELGGSEETTSSARHDESAVADTEISLQEKEEALLNDVCPAPVVPQGYSFLSTAVHGTIGFFSQELPFSLLIATVLTSFGLWFASMIYVSNPDKIAKDLTPPTLSSPGPALNLVGRITGMADVKWADRSTEAFCGAHVSMGRKYALTSGLMEITYNTGAKVILQGPVTYHVESKNGGFLPIGKLTGKVEVETAKGFSIRTPTATVTDLGTEFGVEVSQEGNTTSHVFRGSVEFQAMPVDKAQKPIVRVLHANESARIEYRNAWNGDTRMIVPTSPDNAVAFVREISNQTRQRSDRFEVVAYWQFDGKDFLADSSGHGHTLVNHGVTQIDGTAAFDGKAILSTVDSIDLTPYKRIRVSWQQKTASLATPQVAWEQSSNFNGVVGAIASVLQYGKANAGIRTTGEALAQGYHQDLYNIDQYPALIDVWETIAVEYDRTAYRANVVRVFKDGKEIPTTSLFDGFAPASFINAPFHIGAREGPSDAFVGQIENLKIEGVAVTKKR